MPNNELYFLIMVCGAFAVFAVVLAGSYIKYRQWLKHTPHAAGD
jgi:hypothetical protein